MIADRINKHESLQEIDIMGYSVDTVKQFKKESEEVYDTNVTPANGLTPLIQSGSSNDVDYGLENSEKVHDPALHMDHIFLTFLQFLWCKLALTPNAAFFYVKAVIKLGFRNYFHCRGWLKPKDFDAAKTVAKLCLETAMAIHYRGKKIGEDGTEVAGFFFPDFPTVTNDSKVSIADLLQVDIDLEKKQMVSAKLDNRELTASEVTILLSYYHYGAFHGMSNTFAYTFLFTSEMSSWLTHQSLTYS